MSSNTDSLEDRVKFMLYRLLGKEKEMDYDLAAKDFVKSVGEERAKAYVDMFADLDYEVTKVAVPHIFRGLSYRKL